MLQALSSELGLVELIVKTINGESVLG